MASHMVDKAAQGSGLSGVGGVQGTVAPPPASGVSNAVSPAPMPATVVPPAPLTEAAQSAAPGAVEGAVEAGKSAAQGGADTLLQGVGQAASSAAAQAPVEGVFTWGGYFQAIGLLLVLLGVVWLLVWAVRKYGRFNFLPQPGSFPRDGLRMEAQLPLGPRKGLMVVRFLNKRLLLGVTDHQITLLKEVGDHDEEDVMDFKHLMDAAARQKSDD